MALDTLLPTEFKKNHSDLYISTVEHYYVYSSRPVSIYLRLNTTMFALFVQCIFIYGWTRIEFLL